MNFGLKLAAALVAFAGVVFVVLVFEAPPMDTAQIGYRGLAMEQVANPRLQAAKVAANQVPEPVPAVPAEGPKASEIYQNVQILGHLSAGQFNRLMVAITGWVSPEQGCNYCHKEGAALSDDSLYTKVVARRMLQMTQEINSKWTSHVGATGVTCYTCHRGQPVPAGVWFLNPEVNSGMTHAGWRNGQNMPAKAPALASLPADPFTPYLSGKTEIRVQGNSPLPQGHVESIQATEGTYALMMHMSDGLGVNCTFCHNSRSFKVWDQSTPKRSIAWHGIRMLRDVNNAYLDPLQPKYPPHRLGPLGDAAKANCATCHQGVNKPLSGVSMLKDYPELGGAAAPVAALDGVAADRLVMEKPVQEQANVAGQDGEARRVEVSITQ
ncbi:MAG: photosynthetic reaction center cytochrome PufC [Pseudomonadota bacterium]